MWHTVSDEWPLAVQNLRKEVQHDESSFAKPELTKPMKHWGSEVLNSRPGMI